MKCMKNITLAAFALCATQTVACMAPTDEAVEAEGAAEASELAWANGVEGNCTSPFRGEFQRHDDGMGAHIAWKDACTGSEVVLWIQSANPEQPLYGEVDVIGFIETYDGILGLVNGEITVDADAPQSGAGYFAVERAGVDIGYIESEIRFADPAGQPAYVDAHLKLH